MKIVRFFLHFLLFYYILSGRILRKEGTPMPEENMILQTVADVNGFLNNIVWG